MNPAVICGGIFDPEFGRTFVPLFQFGISILLAEHYIMDALQLVLDWQQSKGYLSQKHLLEAGQNAI